MHDFRNPFPFRNQQSGYIAVAQREPVEITSRGAEHRAVVVSPEFFDRAMEAFENQADILAAKVARTEPRIPFDELMEEGSAVGLIDSYPFA